MNNSEWLRDMAQNDPTALDTWFKAERETNGIDGETNGIAADSPLVEGDAVAIMRKVSGELHAVDCARLTLEATDTSDMFAKFADMVERDYVSREKCDELQRKVDGQREVIRRYQDSNCGKLIAERDELKKKEKQLSNELGLRDKAIELLQDVKQELIEERDEWKAKAEAKSAKRAAAVERLNGIEQATDENLLDAILGAPNGMILYGAEKLVALKALLTDDDGAWRSNDGVTNLEWLVENDREALLDIYDCDDIECDTCAFDKYDICGNLCFGGMRREWLTATHEGTQQDAPNQPNSESDAPKTAQTGEISTSKVDIRDFDADSREQLEADVLKLLKDSYVTYPQIIELLNRQAEITRQSEQAAWIQQANGLIYEANAERDRLSAEVDNLADQLLTSNREREHIRKLLGIALDHAHDVLALVDVDVDIDVDSDSDDYDEGMA